MYVLHKYYHPHITVFLWRALVCEQQTWVMTFLIVSNHCHLTSYSDRGPHSENITCAAVAFAAVWTTSFLFYSWWFLNKELHSAVSVTVILRKWPPCPDNLRADSYYSEACLSTTSPSQKSGLAMEVEVKINCTMIGTPPSGLCRKVVSGYK